MRPLKSSLGAMDYTQLFTPHHIALIHDWLFEIGTISIRLELPHSGCSGETYQIKSLGELKVLIVSQKHTEIEVFIFKKSEVTEEDLNNTSNLSWVYSNSDWILYLARKNNRNYYESYDRNKDQYQEAWFSWEKGT